MDSQSVDWGHKSDPVDPNFQAYFKQDKVFRALTIRRCMTQLEEGLHKA